MIKEWPKHIKQWVAGLNIPLLLFLLLVLNVKIVVKIIVLLLLLIKYRKEVSKKENYRHQFIWFYVAVICIGIINLLLNTRTVSLNYLVALSTGIFFWAMCIGAAVLNLSFINKTNTATLHRTVSFFFLLNCLISILQLIIIMYQSGSINPFIYQGMYQKYFINTGDMITGITMDVCTTNAMISSFGVVYFLNKNKMGLLLLCIVSLVLTGSNFSFLLLSATLLLLFLFQSSKNQKSVIIISLAVIVVFLSKISPQNNNYATTVLAGSKDKKNIPSRKNSDINRPGGLLMEEENKRKIAKAHLDSIKSHYLTFLKNDTLSGASISDTTNVNLSGKPSLPKDNIHTPAFQRKKNTTDIQKKLLAFAEQTSQTTQQSTVALKKSKLPGKLIALKQTVHYLKEHPLKLLAGAGIGNFSSKLAFRTTALNIAGGYPKNWAYTNDDFLKNHLALYLIYFSKDAEIHSLINSPDSVYDQLIAEYGLAGVAAFLFLYLFYFIKRMKRKSYGTPLLLLQLGSLFTSYWFEQLSIVILFELLMLLHIKETTEQV